VYIVAAQNRLNQERPGLFAHQPVC
jgi:hypothetical protein